MSGVVRIVSLGWERTQLVVGLRMPDGLAGAGGVQLAREHEPTLTMEPTGSRRDGDLISVRFNVMVGPDLRPLAPGRWILEARAPGELVADRIGDDGSIDGAAHARTFDVPSGRYRVAIAVDRASPGVVLDVTLDRSVGARPATARGRLGRIRRRILPGSVAYRIAFAAMNVVTRRTGRRILFASTGTTALTGNLQVIHARMVERGLDRDFELRALFRGATARDRTLRQRFETIRALAAADVILLASSRLRTIYLPEYDPDVRIVQLWHASGAFKTVGYSRVGKPGGPDPFSRIHKNYTHAIVSSAHDVPFYAEAFGIPESRVVPTGIPRMDRFFDDAARTAGLEAARAIWPETRDHMTILFAPTFRGNGRSDATYPLERLDYAALHQLCAERDAVAILRMHPFARTDLQIPGEFRDRLLDGYRGWIDVNDLLFAVDLLITDYSSIVFEYATLGRPMLFFAYDLQEYVATRDFYEPFESFVPGRIVRTFPELLDAIRRDDYEIEKVAAFAAGHFAHLDGGSTDRIIDQLILAR